MKYLRTAMPDGSKWDVPAEVIARNRADYYKSKEPSSYDQEYKFAMEDDAELADWAANNMNWEDVESDAVKSRDADNDNDFQEGWVNGKKEVVIKANDPIQG